MAGLLGDVHSRRAVLYIGTAATAAVLAAAAAAAALDAPIAVVFGLAGLYTVVSSAYIPAEGAMLPLLARTPQELSAANVAHSTVDNGGSEIGEAETGAVGGRSRRSSPGHRGSTASRTAEIAVPSRPTNAGYARPLRSPHRPPNGANTASTAIEDANRRPITEA